MNNQFGPSNHTKPAIFRIRCVCPLLKPVHTKDDYDIKIVQVLKSRVSFIDKSTEK